MDVTLSTSALHTAVRGRSPYVPRETLLGPRPCGEVARVELPRDISERHLRRFLDQAFINLGFEIYNLWQATQPKLDYDYTPVY
jgi:hypothetical protein